MGSPEKRNDHCDLIVLTGGPGAGKTAVLEAARKFLPLDVALLPEAATIVYGGGFWRMKSESAMAAAQGAIFHVQREMENLVQSEGLWRFGLCDRGSLDGLAYWPQSEEAYWEHFSTTKEKEYARYKAVIHLQTPSASEGYNFQNPERIESANQAAKIDKKIHEIWKSHPQYFIIKNETSFLEKLIKSLSHLNEIMRSLDTERRIE